MPLKPADKAKLAVVAVLLIVVLAGAVVLYMQSPSGSQPDENRPSSPAAAAVAPSPPKSDFRKFLRLVQSDDTNQVAAMLAQDPSLAKQMRNGDGATGLHLARSVPMVKLLLKNGADINARKSPHYGSPLRWAVSRLWNRDPQMRDVVRFLQSQGASEPDVFFAAAAGDIPQMEKLLAADPSLIEKNSPADDVLFDNCSPLQIAAYADQYDSVKFLIDHGANVHNRSGWHKTEAMEKACWVGGADVVVLLLDHGALVNGPDNVFEDLPIQNAATMGHADVVKILLAHGAAVPRKLIPAVRAAMQHPDTNEGPTPGSPDDFHQVLDMLTAAASTQP